MRILYFNNCWFTNVGEAFIDIGSMNIIKKIWDNPRIACVSDMSDWYRRSISRRMGISGKDVNSAKIYEQLDADYIVMSGMFASEEYLETSGRIMVDYLVKNGVKLVILGLGCEKYSDRERGLLSRYYEETQPRLIITRDKKTYEAFHNCAETIQGIDSAFWVKDSFDPRGFSKQSYEVYTFNMMNEPLIEKVEEKVVRPWHMQWETVLSDLKEDFLISDSPYDYLTTYANAKRVYTDLVHATIPSLEYGVPVKYYYYDERSSAFDSVEGLCTDGEGFMTVKEETLEKQKQYLIGKIRELL